MKDRLTILCGDALEQLKTLPDESVHCCVTSPPYWGLRDYGVPGQLGLEKTPEEYVAKMVAVFREVKRVLRDDGTCWVNLGDSYNGYYANQRGTGLETERQESRPYFDPGEGLRCGGLKPKDLCGIPWRVAFALQNDGWWLRQEIIWHKPSTMPESVTDRCTKAHEQIFLLAKSERYYFDNEAIKEPCANEPHSPGNKLHPDKISGPNDRNGHSQWETSMDKVWGESGMRNKRSVWTVTTQPYSEAHFATYPPDLIKPCILAGTSAKGCCEKCGAPWWRMVDYGPIHGRSENDGKGYKLNKAFLATETGQNNRANGFMPNHTREIKTIGWQPTCECNAGVVPCTVLDCFGGSGTTGMVALELGRKAILIELNPEYVHLIKQRCDVTLGLPLA